jgi:hypothetical protein
MAAAGIDTAQETLRIMMHRASSEGPRIQLWLDGMGSVAWKAIAPVSNKQSLKLENLSLVGWTPIALQLSHGEWCLRPVN